jgi:hypothetical protein
MKHKDLDYWEGFENEITDLEVNCARSAAKAKRCKALKLLDAFNLNEFSLF